MTLKKCVLCFFGVLLGSSLFAKPTLLTLEKFVELATAHDTQFERILLDQVPLAYQQTLGLPVKDLIASIKLGSDVYFEENRSATNGSISLSKLFPKSGTTLTSTYSTSGSSTSPDQSSVMTFGFSQSIAQNAFGQTVRWRSQLIGYEVETARTQIIEAYEDYLASLIKAYVRWANSYEKLRIAKYSYDNNKKVLDNIKVRQKNSIAKPIDVQKVEIQLLSKESSLRVQETEYKQALNTLLINLNLPLDQEFTPTLSRHITVPRLADALPAANSRTGRLLDLLETKANLSRDIAENEILPSLTFNSSLTLQGAGTSLEDSTPQGFAGFTLALPLERSQPKAAYEVAKNESKKATIARQKLLSLRELDLRNLYQDITLEFSQLEISAKRIALGEAIVAQEGENYTFGKATLNDYIQAVNTLDTTRLEYLIRLANCHTLLTEWQRLSDRLVASVPASK